MSVTVSKALADNYANYYHQGHSLKEWRRLGAVNKCANITALCDSLTHDRVLDIGCGEGALIERLLALQFAHTFTGLEISPSGVESAQGKHLPNANFEIFDGYTIPFADRQFDLAILSHVVEHIEHPRQLIYEALRVAENVFIEVPLEDTLRLPIDFVFDPVGHINFYNVATIRSLVQSCAAQVIAARLSHGGRDTYVYRLGRVKGMFAHALKEAGIRCLPAIASQFVTYHYALICRPRGN